MSLCLTVGAKDWKLLIVMTDVLCAAVMIDCLVMCLYRSSVAAAVVDDSCNDSVTASGDVTMDSIHEHSKYVLLVDDSEFCQSVCYSRLWSSVVICLLFTFLYII